MTRVLRAAAACFVATAVMVAVVVGAGDSALTKAVKAGDLQAVRTLVKQGADVNVKSGDGSTPLLWAADGGAHEIARALVAAKAKVDVATDLGVTPLLQAARVGDATMVDILLRAGANPSLAHPDGETPLMAASRSGSVAAVKALLARGAKVNDADRFQSQTALMLAAAQGHVDVAGVLLEAGADANKQAHATSLATRKNADHPTGGFTALMWAARNGNEAMVRRLATGGANLNLKNGDGASAMMIAIWNDRFDMAATLAGLGADVNDGSLYVAVEMRDSTTDQFAFDGSRRRPDNPNKLTALDLIKLLLDKGADPNKRFAGQFHSTSMPNSDRFDNTPFYRAALLSDVEALKVLIASKKVDLEQSPSAASAGPVDPDAPVDEAPAGRGRGNPNAGRTAAMVAMTGGRGPGMTGGPGYIRAGEVPYREPGSRKGDDAFKVLIEAGANPNAKAPDGQTLLHQVARAGNLELIKVLAAAKVDFEQKNNDGLTALDVAEGKRPAGAAPAGPGRGRGAPPAGGRGGRGGGRGAASPQDVAKLLRELMGLPPAPPAPAATEAPAAAPATDAPAAEVQQ